eukprot:UN06799
MLIYMVMINGVCLCKHQCNCHHVVNCQPQIVNDYYCILAQFFFNYWFVLNP